MHNVPFSTFGITGKAGVGKTTVTDILCGRAAALQTKVDNTVIEWSQSALSIPLKELVAAKRIMNKNTDADRRLYEIHRILTSVYGEVYWGSMPSYEELFYLVRKIDKLPLGSAKDNYREFQQKAGDLIRSFDKNAFGKALYKRALTKISDIEKTSWEFEEQDIGYQRVLVVSDIRFKNEAEYLKDTLGVVIYELTADKKTRSARLIDRDGLDMPAKAKKHKSENGIPDKLIDISIDTSDKTPEDVAEIIRNDIYNRIGA